MAYISCAGLSWTYDPTFKQNSSIIKTDEIGHVTITYSSETGHSIVLGMSRYRHFFTKGVPERPCIYRHFFRKGHGENSTQCLEKPITRYIMTIPSLFKVPISKRAGREFVPISHSFQMMHGYSRCYGYFQEAAANCLPDLEHSEGWAI